MAIAQQDIGGDIRTLQQKLKDLGYYNGPLDSIFGPESQKAMDQYQLGIPPAYSALRVPTEEGSPTPTPTPTPIPTVAPPISGTVITTPPPVAGATLPSTPPATDAKIPAPTVGKTTGGMGGTTGGTVAPVADTTTPEFTYDPTKDAAYQAALAETNRAIANAMNRRGIYGSTIMQENLRSADVGLLDTYTQLAKEKYDQGLVDRQNKMDQAYENAKKRGYYNNEEAALWGVPAGTRISSYSPKSSGSLGGDAPDKATQQGEDGTYYDANGNPVLDDTQKNVYNYFKEIYKSSPDESEVMNKITWLMEQEGLTDVVLAEIFKNSPIVLGKSASYWLDRWYAMQEQMAQAAAQNTPEARYMNQVIRQENRWGY